MRNIKSFLLIGLVAAVLFAGIGGCIKLDYHFFKQKFPESGVGGYLWHQLSK